MLVIASELYWPETTSTGKYVTRVAEGLAGDGDVLVLCAQPTYAARGRLAPREEVRNGVRIRRLRSTTLDKDRLLPRLINALTFGVAALLAGLRHVPRGATVMAVTNPPLLPFLMGVVCRVKRARLVLLIHDVYPEVLVASGLVSSEGLAARLLARATRRLYGEAKEIVVLGRDQKALVERKDPEGGKRAIVIPHWMDEGIEPFERNGHPLLAELGWEDHFVVQYAGNMGRSHDLEGILAAAEALGDDAMSPGFGFLLIGWGAKRRKVEEEVDRRRLRHVRVLDPRPDSELSSMLGACDVALIALAPGMAGVSVPSRMYNVMAAARPIIAVADAESELASVVREEGIGWVVAPGDTDALVEALRSARDQEEARREMGCRARRAALEKYTFAKALPEYAAAVGRVTP